ncbi:MAG TPA: DoxX family protein [Candidatus Polarisedimenticolaceae bacterium]|nr:DoxX family protein [Candidatus Polarisedimenticolaceae bacterium]
MASGGLKSVLFSPGTYSRAASLGLLLLRLGAGGMMIYGHGWGKLLGFGERSAQFPDPLGIGHVPSMAGTVGAEVVCAALVMIGFATRIAALPLVFTMAVAGFVINAGAPWGDKELAVIYLVPFLALVFTGPGAYSLDAKIAGGGRRR